MLFGEQTVTIKRFDDGSWVTGDFVRGAAIPDFTVLGSLQPDGDTSPEGLERGSRERGRFLLYVEDKENELKIVDLAVVREGDVIITGDPLALNPTRLVVVGVQDWSGHQTGCPHRRYVLESIGDDEPNA